MPRAYLRAVHQAAVLVVEAVAAVHGDAVVPHDQIALAPGMRPGEFRLGNVAPQLIQQRLAFFDRQTHHIGVQPPAQVERAVAAFRVGDDQRVDRAGGSS